MSAVANARAAIRISPGPQRQCAVQGCEKENCSAFIALGTDDLLHGSNGLEVLDNDPRLVPGLSRTSVFLADWTGSRIVILGSRLAAGLKPHERR